MKINKKIVCWAVSLGMIIGVDTTSQCQTRKDNGNISPRVIKPYFVNSAKDIPGELRLLLNAPKEEPSLPADKHLQVCQAFAWWARKVVKPDYVPNDAFIIAHLQLFPATPGRKQDMALLSCQKEDLDYLIIQTGGVNGRVFFVTDRSNTSGSGKNASSKAVMTAAITNYLHLSQDDEIPDFVTEKHGALHILKPEPLKTKRNRLTRAEGIISNGQIAVSVLKRFFIDTAAAHEPAPDKWFEWEMAKALKKTISNPD